ncbi:hypothetical protein BC834DRAFT_142935 [Gloeopeniophorella convolvens]|nr:hypothetical protein BC834DRAFT_142935 [Gloeopeniophorella convolvens]
MSGGHSLPAAAQFDALSQVVSSFDTSAVTYSTNGWDEDVQSDFHNSTSSSEAATSIVTLTFRGTRAGAFGTMSSHGTEPLNGTIISLSTSKATPLPQSQPSDDNKTQAYYFADTQSLTCDTYNLTLSVDNRHQKMMLHQFAFAPCLGLSRHDAHNLERPYRCQARCRCTTYTPQTLDLHCT